MPKVFLPETFSKIIVHLLGVIFCATRTSTDMGISSLLSRSIHDLGGDFITAELLEP